MLTWKNLNHHQYNVISIKVWANHVFVSDKICIKACFDVQVVSILAAFQTSYFQHKWPFYVIEEYHTPSLTTLSGRQRPLHKCTSNRRYREIMYWWRWTCLFRGHLRCDTYDRHFFIAVVYARTLDAVSMCISCAVLSFSFQAGNVTLGFIMQCVWKVVGIFSALNNVPLGSLLKCWLSANSSLPSAFFVNIWDRLSFAV